MFFLYESCFVLFSIEWRISKRTVFRESLDQLQLQRRLEPRTRVNIPYAFPGNINDRWIMTLCFSGFLPYISRPPDIYIYIYIYLPMYTILTLTWMSASFGMHYKQQVESIRSLSFQFLSSPCACVFVISSSQAMTHRLSGIVFSISDKNRWIALQQNSASVYYFYFNKDLAPSSLSCM